MFSDAKEEKQKSIENAVNCIQKRINKAVNEGLNTTRFPVQDYYMGKEVQEGLKNAGYDITKNEAKLGVSSTYTISW